MKNGQNQRKIKIQSFKNNKFWETYGKNENGKFRKKIMKRKRKF